MSTEVAVVGSGPNGLAAAVTMARAGLGVTVFERNAWLGGGAATGELTLPGFRHDLASAVHPMALASPFFQAFELQRRIDLLVPEISYAHPLGHRSAIAERDLERTVERLGPDGPAYRRLMRPLVQRIEALTAFSGRPLSAPPLHLLGPAIFGLAVLEQGSTWTWNRRWREDLAPALIAGCSAHTIGHQPRLSTTGAGLMLAAHAHAAGWPVPRGGSQAISDALAQDLRAHGGTITLGHPIVEAGQLSGYRTVLFDTSAAGLARIGGTLLPERYRRALRALKPGNGVAKIDLALSGPVPWSDPEVGRAPTVHLGGTRAQIAASENAVARGELPDQPYVLLVQPSVIDPTRAPAGQQTLWAYTHVPYDCPVDRTEAMLDALDQHAPGIRDLVIGQHATPANQFDSVSENFTGGDFAVGAVTMRQLARRPVLSPKPWRTPVSGWFLASSAASPGPSVHGLAGWQAALTALRDQYQLPAPDLALGAS